MQTRWTLIPGGESTLFDVGCLAGLAIGNDHTFLVRRHSMLFPTSNAMPHVPVESPQTEHQQSDCQSQ